MITKKDSIAFIIPAYNEGLVIASTIESLLHVAPKEDIYVVNGNSIDETGKVARTYTENVLDGPNLGKAGNINNGIKHFDLIRRYKYIMPVDAETILSHSLPDVVTSIFSKDKDKKIAAVICKVHGRNHCLTTAYRMWEYELAQVIHKSAQGEINSIIVCPGCSTVFRSEVLNKVMIPTSTMTEDMDLTFTIHRQNLGKIVFTQKATVTTQDPKTLPEYSRQLKRWYGGFWQCVIKHKVPWGGQILDAEVTLLAIEGLFNGLLSYFMIVAIPLFILINPKAILFPILFDLIFFAIPSLIYVSIKHKTLKLLKYLPIFYVIRIFNSILFINSFVRALVGIKHKKHFVWDTARYSVRKEDASWAIQSLQ